MDEITPSAAYRGIAEAIEMLRNPIERVMDDGSRLNHALSALHSVLESVDQGADLNDVFAPSVEADELAHIG